MNLLSEIEMRSIDSFYYCLVVSSKLLSLISFVGSRVVGVQSKSLKHDQTIHYNTTTESKTTRLVSNLRNKVHTFTKLDLLSVA